jgi:DNA-binding HxlR family transcriptional regulator
VSSDIEPIPEIRPRVCSIADALQLVGERWSLLVIREIGLGARRFNDIRENTGAPRETVTVRLRKLEDAAVVTRRRYLEPPRDEYLLTEAGEALVPILRSLRVWGEQFATPYLRNRAD